MDMIIITRLVVGYSVSLCLGQVVTGWCIRKLWGTVPSQNGEPSLRTGKNLSFWLGTAERALYTSTICLGRPEGIAVWLAFKAIMRWKVLQDDLRHIPGSSIYQIGTIVSLAFGIAGGLIVMGKWTL